MKELFRLVVLDRCMADILLEGDLVFVDRRRRTLLNGNLYTVKIGSRLDIRRIHTLSDWLVRIICDNPFYPPQELPLSDLKILGQVVLSVRVWA